MTNSRTTQRHLGTIGWTILAACVFALALLVPSPSSAQPTYTVIHNFTGGVGGERPEAGLVVDHAGNLYGTTDLGGPADGCQCGIVFELNPSSGLFTKLWQFTGGSDGGYPQSTLLIGPGGALYGTADGGGVYNCNMGQGCGTVFRLSPPVTPPRSIQDDHWIENTLYSFQGPPSDGGFPTGDLATDHSGNIYGATILGTVFELTYSNGGWRESILHVGLNWPSGGVTLDAAATFMAPRSTAALFTSSSPVQTGRKTFSTLSPSGTLTSLLQR